MVVVDEVAPEAKAVAVAPWEAAPEVTRTVAVAAVGFKETAIAVEEAFEAVVVGEVVTMGTWFSGEHSP